MVDTFTREQFEAALPLDKQGRRLWKSLGLDHGEYVYLIPVNNDVTIMVRSSVKPSGTSAATGEDSIRAYLVYADGHQPAASKLNKYTTRVPGWQARLTDMLRKLWVLGRALTPCPLCQSKTRANIVQKEGPNKGRAFRGCANRNCGLFQWLTDEPVSKLKVPAPKKEATHAA